MINNDIKEKINKVLEVEFEIEPNRLQPDAALFTDLELDSLDVVDLIVALEQAFNIKIRTDDAQEFRDVRTLSDLHTTVQQMYEKLHKKSNS